MNQTPVLLCMDAGNTLVKWCLFDNLQQNFSNAMNFSSQPTSELKPFENACTVLGDLLSSVLSDLDNPVAAVLLCNVLGPDFERAVRRLCEQHHVKGLILLAREGINSTIAGAPEDVHAVLAYLRSDPKLADLEHKESFASKPPFHRMKVRLKKEIVTLGVPGISPTHRVGQYVKPKDWNALISSQPMHASDLAFKLKIS